MKQPTFKWDAETGTATYTIWDADGVMHTGTAVCHADDADMMNERTGLEIACRRAQISAYKAFKYKTENELSALKQLYYSMKHSSKFNPKAYESVMLYRQIRLKEEDLATVKEIITRERLNLKIYIAEKEAFYKQLRILRKRKAFEDAHDKAE